MSPPGLERAPLAARPPTLVRNDLIRALHEALLAKLGVDWTLAFWARHPLPLGDKLIELPELGAHVRNELAHSPLGWYTAVLNDVEPFLVAHGASFQEIVDATLSQSNHGSFARARHALSWLSPVLTALIRFGDPYRLIFRASTLTSRKLCPGVLTKEVPCRLPLPPGIRAGTILVACGDLLRGEVPPWDGPSFTGRPLQVGPRIIGLDPFGLSTLSDARCAETVVVDARCERRDECFLIDGVAYGRLLPFSEYCEQAGYDLQTFALPDPEVVLIEQDYICPVRRRVVLEAGCAYGASGYLFRLSWSDSALPKRNPLSILIAESASERTPEQRLVDARHHDFMHAALPSLRATYFVADGSISLNDQLVCRGVPALILRECLRSVRDEGRQEFGFREFKRNPALVSHPKNTGFEIRLRRLRETLDAANCGIRIEKTGRGKFRLACNGRVTLEERP